MSSTDIVHDCFSCSALLEIMRLRLLATFPPLPSLLSVKTVLFVQFLGTKSTDSSLCNRFIKQIQQLLLQLPFLYRACDPWSFSKIMSVLCFIVGSINYAYVELSLLEFIHSFTASLHKSCQVSWFLEEVGSSRRPLGFALWDHLLAGH